jgi:hypothetical protein
MLSGIGVRFASQPRATVAVRSWPLADSRRVVGFGELTSYYHVIMNPEDATAPTRLQRWWALGGLLALVFAVPVVFLVFGTAALSWVLVVGGLLVSTLAVGVVVRTRIARRFPVTDFNLADVSQPAGQIERAKERLARGDYAAFTVNAVRDPADPEASGQIWVYAAKSGGIQKTSLELSYEWSTEPAENSALRQLLSDGWEVIGWEPHQWVLLSRPGDVSATEAIQSVANALAMMFDVPPSSQWTFRAFA